MSLTFLLFLLHWPLGLDARGLHMLDARDSTSGEHGAWHRAGRPGGLWGHLPQVPEERRHHDLHRGRLQGDHPLAVCHRGRVGNWRTQLPGVLSQAQGRLSPRMIIANYDYKQNCDGQMLSKIKKNKKRGVDLIHDLYLGWNKNILLLHLWYMWWHRCKLVYSSFIVFGKNSQTHRLR